MNIYKVSHIASCPNGQLNDCYEITIASSSTIMVEFILKTLKESPSEIYQEDLATLLRSKTGAEITIKGWHHGIHITTIRK